MIWKTRFTFQILGIFGALQGTWWHSEGHLGLLSIQDPFLPQEGHCAPADTLVVVLESSFHLSPLRTHRSQLFLGFPQG